MKKNRVWGLLALFSLLLLLTACRQGASQQSDSTAPIKITYWHRMTGTYAKSLDKLINQFNASQKKYRVVATSQGS